MLDKLIGVALATLIAAKPSAAADLTVPYPPAQAQERIIKAVGQLAPGHPDHRRYRIATPYGAALFPPDSDFNDRTGGQPLASWLALPPAQRQYDVLITPDVDFYWPADGMMFTCKFIVHIDPAGAGEARLSILQVDPTKYLGKKFHPLGRTGPHFYMELKPAPQSPQATTALRTLLAAVLDAGSPQPTQEAK
ncbi:hypothetical protein RugamoR64_62100 [Duganella rhizosphaerae]|uniref:hypothetical protein n=1 Tax=Duganella rhizosphaerae TaxID=2885763 RepID=UPI0030E9BE3B